MCSWRSGGNLYYVYKHYSKWQKVVKDKRETISLPHGRVFRSLAT